MKKIYLYAVGIFFLLLLVWLPPTASKAAEGECHLKHCLVPAPTVFEPEVEEITSARPVITGLTWKTTIVKVYLDGQELTEVKQVRHEDYYGSFYVQPKYNLSPGRHYVYTIANSEKSSWYDQSPESKYIYFTVPATVKDSSSELEPTSHQSEIEETNGNEIEVNTTKKDKENLDIIEAENQHEVDVVDESHEPELEVAEGMIEGGVYVEADNIAMAELPTQAEENQDSQAKVQEAASFEEIGDVLEDEFASIQDEETARRNRLVGIVMLVIIFITSLIWLAVSKNSIRKQFAQKETGDLPPPPKPPETVKKIQTDRSMEEAQISYEPIKEEEEKDYWAAPPSSDYTAYQPDERQDDEPVDKIEL